MPPTGWEGSWSGFPRPGDPAPSLDAMDTGSCFDRDRHAWEVSHVAWLNANGLSCTAEELRAWYDNPDRDHLPMPGVLQWQQRISQQYSWRAAVIGVEPAHRSTGPALDAAAAQEAQELRQARDADAERITWLENALSQAAEKLSDSRAKGAALADYIARQEETIRDQARHIQQQAATIEQRATEIGQLNHTVRQKDAEIQRCRADAARLNSIIVEKIGVAGRLEARIGELNATIRRQDAAIEGLRSEALLRRNRAPDERARDLEPPGPDEDRVTGQVVTQVRALEAENERLRRRLARNAAASPAQETRRA